MAVIFVHLSINEFYMMKKNYAEEHNIELLEIWYYDFDNIENILGSRLLKQSA